MNRKEQRCLGCGRLLSSGLSRAKGYCQPCDIGYYGPRRDLRYKKRARAVQREIMKDPNWRIKKYLKDADAPDR